MGVVTKATLQETLEHRRQRIKDLLQPGAGERAWARELREALQLRTLCSLVAREPLEEGETESESEALRRSNLLSQQGIHAAAPFMVLPSGPATTIPTELMKIMFALRFHLPMAALKQLEGLECLCKPGKHIVPHIIDIYGRHFLCCTKFTKTILRHDKLKTLLAGMMEEAGYATRTEPTNWARVLTRWHDGVGEDEEEGGLDAVPAVKEPKLDRPDFVVSGAGANGANLTVDVACCMTGLMRHDVPAYQHRGKTPATSPAIQVVQNNKHSLYDVTARAKGEVFKGFIMGHGGQLSIEACYVLEVAIRGIAERRGIEAGTVRSWWTSSFCTEMAKHSARMLLDAASAMIDSLPNKRRHHTAVEFERDLVMARNMPAFERNVAAEGFQRSNGCELPPLFLQELGSGRNNGYSMEAAVVAGASGDDAVAVAARG